MWGSQGWNQWALQPAMFNDVPHEQIDWAELAKQWIQMQQTQPSDSVPHAPPPPPLPPPPPPQVVPPVSLPPPPGHVPLMPEEFPEGNIAPPLLKPPVPPAVIPEPFHSERPFENEPAPFIPKTTDNNSFWSKPQWESSASNDVDDRLWTSPPVEPAAPLLAGKETFDYGHMHDNAPLAMQSIDYNHMSDFSYNQVYPTPTPAPETHYDQYWSQVNAAPTISPIFLKKERSTANLHVEEETTQIDAAKRKQLPAWIRDGLEKMEQERLKRLEKERAAKENAEKMAKISSLRKDLGLKDDSSVIPMTTKSKFESDSEDENDTDELVVNKSSPVPKRIPSPVEDTRTEEEKKQDLVLKVRRTLTEILLSVTNSEMIDIVKEMYRKAVSKAPARQLASSTSLTSVASGLRGLASYGTESEASDQEEEDVSDSEEELYRKIKEKKRLFAQKEKKIIADLERKEYEEKNELEKINNDKNKEKKLIKEFTNPEKLDEATANNIAEKNDASNVPFQSEEHNAQVLPNKQSLKTEETDQPNEANIEATKSIVEDTKLVKKDESVSSDSVESSSSESSSESSEKRKKKSHKEVRKVKSESKKFAKKEKNSVKHSSHHRRSRSRESGSSGKHWRERSRDRKNSSRKRKKYKRSDSSSSSSSSTRKKKRSSSKYQSSHSHRERRSRSYDDREKKRRRSVSPSRGYRKSDSHLSRSSRSHRHEDDKYERRHKEEKKYREFRHSPSPSEHSSRLPRKYRSSRSLSSESQSSGKKSKKSRNR